MAETKPNRQGAAALALRLAGAGYDEVADALGMNSADVARQAAEAALAARAWGNTEGREKLRQENSARIERLLRGVWVKATNPDHPEHLPAVKVASALIQQHTKLHGLDAPTEVVIHNPTASEIDQWVASILSESTAELRAMEAPIVDDDIVEGELVD